MTDLIDDVDDFDWVPEVDPDDDARSGVAGRSDPRLTPGEAYWPRDPGNAPDTWHLPPGAATDGFAASGDLIRALMENCDMPLPGDDHGKLLVAIRGAQLQSGAAWAEDQDSIPLTSVRPDHETYRCVIGMLDLNTDRLSLYRGSTVPRRTGMARYANGGRNCNMLPTGRYGYCVGTHYSQRRNKTLRLQGVLRLGRGPEPGDATAATVLRTSNDLAYGTRDRWDKTIPRDNIHPAFIPGSFSSLGCLTLEGRQQFDTATDSGTGAWKQFKEATGFSHATRGTRYRLLLVTGHELAAYAGVGGALRALRCLRQGSFGDAVAELQKMLGGIRDDGDFGATTAERLTSVQTDKLGYATGTWSDAMAQALNMPTV